MPANAMGRLRLSGRSSARWQIDGSSRGCFLVNAAVCVRYRGGAVLAVTGPLRAAASRLGVLVHTRRARWRLLAEQEHAAARRLLLEVVGWGARVGGSEQSVGRPRFFWGGEARVSSLANAQWGGSFYVAAMRAVDARWCSVRSGALFRVRSGRRRGTRTFWTFATM